MSELSAALVDMNILNCKLLPPDIDLNQEGHNLLQNQWCHFHSVGDHDIGSYHHISKIQVVLQAEDPGNYPLAVHSVLEVQ